MNAKHQVLAILLRHQYYSTQHIFYPTYFLLYLHSAEPTSLIRVSSCPIHNLKSTPWTHLISFTILRLDRLVFLIVWVMSVLRINNCRSSSSADGFHRLSPKIVGFWMVFRDEIMSSSDLSYSMAITPSARNIFLFYLFNHSNCICLPLGAERCTRGRCRVATKTWNSGNLNCHDVAFGSGRDEGLETHCLKNGTAKSVPRSGKCLEASWG